MFLGSMVALVTPMKPNGQIDWTCFDRLIEWHIESGTTALVVLGTTGESPAITPDERIQLIEQAVATTKGRVPVIVGTGTNATASSIELTMQATELGADGVLVVTPYYNRPPQAGLYSHFEAVARATHLPIILYNVPTRTGCDLLPETAVALSAIPNVVAIKEATGGVARLAEYQALGSDLILLSGDDDTCAEFMLHGGHGVITVAGNIAPRQMQVLCEAALASDRPAVNQCQTELLPLFRAIALQVNPIPIKWAAMKMGLIPSGIRLPLIELDASFHDQVAGALAKVGLLVHTE